MKIDCGSEWHHHLAYLDCNNELEKTHDYYHQIQGTMTAVGVEWCDFVIWSPSNMKVQRIYRDFGWSMRYLTQLESLYKHHIVRKEDFDECDSDEAAQDTDEEPFEPYEHPARDLTSILHPIGPAAMHLRHLVIQTLHIHLARWIFQMQSMSRSGHKWKKAVDQFWHGAVDKICETCIRKMFREKIQHQLSSEYCTEVNDIIKNIKNEEAMWSTLLFDPDFAATLKARVQTWEPTMDMRLAPCTCHPYTRTTTLRYGHPTLHQSTFVMPHRSLAGIGQDQLDAPNNEPFPKLKQARKPPMLKYERQLGTYDNSTTHDERYPSTLYKERFHFIYYHYSHHHHPFTINIILIPIPQKLNGPPKGKSEQDP